MSYVKAILAALAVAVAVIFMIQNIDALSHPLSLRLNLFFVSLESTPFATYLIILLTFFIGLLAASLLGLAERFRMRKENKNLGKEIDRLNKELSSLRNLPITSETMGEPEALPAPEPEPAPVTAPAPLDTPDLEPADHEEEKKNEH